MVDILHKEFKTIVLKDAQRTKGRYGKKSRKDSMNKRNISEKIENKERNQIEILYLKSTITEMKIQ